MKFGNNELVKNGHALPLMEQFLTIQGEGFHSGKAAYFIRLAGCDVGCHWCDVKESWEADKYPATSVKQIIREVSAANTDMVIITGGEPLMYNLDFLCIELKSTGIKIHLETSGAYMLSGCFDWICLSPKKFKKPVESIYKKADELKIIVFNKSDLEWAEQNAALVLESCHLLLQPEWSRSKQMNPLIVEYVKKNPKWKISLQTHKYIGVR